jgi:hypothetical protein
MVALKKQFAMMTITVLVIFSPVFSSQAAEIKGVHFSDTVRLGDAELFLNGLDVLKWAMLFDVYAGAFYLPKNHSGRLWTEDIPKILELSYFRSINGKDFAVSSDTLLRENLSKEELKRIEVRLNTLYGLFKDVKPGDRYRLAYSPGKGTELLLNASSLGTIPGHDFAVAYFGIWLGKNPINKNFRDRLLGID